MNKTSNNERFNWKSMSSTLHPINTRKTFKWRKAEGISVKWRNYLKREGIGKRNPIANCFFVKYIMLLGRSVEDRVSPSVSWIGILSGIWKRAQNSRSERTLTGCSRLRHPTLVFFYPLCWGILLSLVEVTPSLGIMLSGSNSCGNLFETTQLSKPITQPIHLSALPQHYNKKPRRTPSPNLNGLATKTCRTSPLARASPLGNK